MIAQLCLCLLAVGVDGGSNGNAVKLGQPNALKLGGSELTCLIALVDGDRIVVGDSLRLRIQFELNGGSSAILFNPFFDNRTMQHGGIVAVDTDGKYVRDLLVTATSMTQHIPKATHWIELPPNAKLERTVKLYPTKEPAELKDIGGALGVGKYQMQLVCNDKLTSLRLPETTHKDFALAQRLFNGPILNHDVVRSNVIEFEIIAKEPK